MVTIFGVKHLCGKRNLNYEIHGSITPGAPQVGPNMHKQISSLLLYSHKYEEKSECMVMVSMKPSTKNVKFMAHLGSEVRALGWGQYDHIVKMY